MGIESLDFTYPNLMTFFKSITFGALLLLPALCSAADQDSIRIALFTDPHFTEGNLKQTTPRMPLLAQDANHRILDIDLVMGLGDEVHDHAAWIGVWKRELQSHLNLPYTGLSDPNLQPVRSS